MDLWWAIILTSSIPVGGGEEPGELWVAAGHGGVQHCQLTLELSVLFAQLL